MSEQQDKQLGWFEKCCELNEKLYDYLSVELKELKPVKQYVISYFQHIHQSKLSCVDIKLKGITKYNTSISLGSMLCETDIPYKLILWKYNGEHHFKDIDLKEISENDFPKYLKHIRDFFELIPKCGYEQLTLF